MNTDLAAGWSARGMLFALGLAATLGWAPAVLANIVQNPGFEADAALLIGTCNGTLPNTGQSAACVGPAGWSASGNAGADIASPKTGSVDAFLGTGTLAQTLATVAGATYSISFHLAADQATLTDALLFFLGIGGSDPTVGVGFGGDDVTGAALGGPIDGVGSYLGGNAGDYLPWTFTDIATGPSTTLVFDATNPIGTWYIDDVSVECVADCGGSTTPVPEPAGATILFALLALRPRRRG